MTINPMFTHPGVVQICPSFFFGPHKDHKVDFYVSGQMSAYLGCNEWLFQLNLPFYLLKSVGPFSSDL